MFVWHRHSTAFVVFPLIAGIGVAINTTPFHPNAIWWATGLGLLFIMLVGIGRINRQWRWQPLLIALAGAMLFFSGIALVHQRTDPHFSNHYSHFLKNATGWVATIQAPPQTRTNSIRLSLQIQQARMGDSSVPVFGKALAYVPRDSVAQGLTYGTRLYMKQRLEPIDSPANPHEFNYKRYLSFKNIYHQGYFPEGSWHIIDREGGLAIMHLIYTIRHYFLDIITTYIPNPRSQSVASALLVGYKAQLAPETLTAYASTGAMHVLAVSGLHVGIIYLVLQRIFTTLWGKYRKPRWVPAVPVAIGIWLFAAITGLSPSVIRAATMFSFVLVGRHLKRPVPVQNSIAASAFLLLIIDPYLLTEIGFLLSYAAVLGIVYWQPRLYRLLYVPNRILDWVWQITCVSIAAQLATCVIGILFFHQFPTYFLFSNLIVIPAAILVLHGGLLLFAASVIPVVASWVGWLLSLLLEALNDLIFWIETWPNALLHPLTLTIPQAVAIYIGLLALSGWLIHRYRAGLPVAALMLILLLGSFQWQSLQRWPSRGLTVYAVDDHTAINIHDGTEAWLIADSALLADDDKMLFHIRHHGWYAGWKDWAKVPREQLPVTSVQIDTLAWWQAPPQKAWDTTTTTLILSRNSAITPKHLMRLPNLQRLVLDGSHTYGSIRFWKQQGKKYGWDIIAVATEGAFTCEI